MQLAKTLLKIWALRVWIAVGAVLSVAAAVVSMSTLHAKVYSTASTQMVVDASRSALGDARVDLTPYTTRAFVFARLMTTSQALQYIGHAANIPGNLIAASGPTELAGPQATHTPAAAQGVQLTSSPARYTLNFLQNPALPTVDVYAEAPTTKQAIALANGAVTGFAAYINYLDNQSSVPAGQRIVIRQAGSATGGVVDPGAGAALAAIIFVVVLALWCALVLFVTNLRAHLRLAHVSRNSREAAAANFAHPSPPVPADAPLNAREAQNPTSGGDVDDYVLRGATSSYGGGDFGEARRFSWARRRVPDDVRADD